jgi:hypothetical protein
MAEVTDDLAFQQGHCGCGCGQFEESQVPDQSAVSVAVVDTRPVETEIEYIVENDDILFDSDNSFSQNHENHSHSPPLILDNRYTPLLC